MNYIKVPHSDLKLVDGSVVILARFPGTKWVVHEGWYIYNNCKYSGWYFSSIPAKTVMPLNMQDLIGVSLVSGKYDEVGPEVCGPPPVGPGFPPVHPDHCFPPDHHHHHHPPCPPAPCPPPVWPPMPPGPEPEFPAFFSVKKELLLDAAFISLPTLKYRDKLDPKHIPDGKIVRINSVNGEPAYYVWSQYDEEWKQVSVEEKIREALEHYYNKGEINRMVSAIEEAIAAANGRIDDTNVRIDDVIAGHQQDMDDIADKFDAVDEELQDLHQTDEDNFNQLTASIAGLDERLDAVEDAVFDVKKLIEITGSNTVLVSDNGGIADSGVSIGDDTIGEPSEYADDKTLATEKAVAKKVEESTPKWASF